MAKEQWRAVVGFEGKYEVSDRGRVRSLDRLVAVKKRDGKRYNIRRRGTILALQLDTYGYHVVSVCDRKRLFVHRAVLEAFVGPAPRQTEGCHKNDIKNDNRLSNLYWGTRIENCADGKRNGRRACGIAVRSAKLTPGQVREIRRRLSRETCASIANCFGVTRGAISQIKLGNTWSHIQ